MERAVHWTHLQLNGNKGTNNRESEMERERKYVNEMRVCGANKSESFRSLVSLALCLFCSSFSPALSLLHLYLCVGTALLAFPFVITFAHWPLVFSNCKLRVRFSSIFLPSHEAAGDSSERLNVLPVSYSLAKAHQASCTLLLFVFFISSLFCSCTQTASSNN